MEYSTNAAPLAVESSAFVVDSPTFLFHSFVFSFSHEGQTDHRSQTQRRRPRGCVGVISLSTGHMLTADETISFGSSFLFKYFKAVSIQKVLRQ
jgi:hypothetical protein